MYSKRQSYALIAFVAICAFFSGAARAADVAIAGFAFAGDFSTAPTRFPYAFQVYKRLQDKASAGSLSRQVTERSKLIQNPALSLMSPEALVNLRQSDQALMTVLLLTGETVSTENFGSYYKTFVSLRGDALIFDYKNKTVVRSYPISVALFDATPDEPAPQRVEAFVEQLLVREDGKGLVTQFSQRLATATLPVPGHHNIQVRKAELAPEALAMMPEALRQHPKVLESMLADSFASILSAKSGVPVLPSSVGHAMGTMALRLENGDEYNLKLEEGHYLFDIRLNKFAKIKTAETKIGTSYVYGAYANIHFYEPTLNTDFLNTDLKNGEVAVVPAGLLASDDFAAFQDAIRGMFLKLNDAFETPDSKWAATAASAKDIVKQLEATRVILKASK